MNKALQTLRLLICLLWVSIIAAIAAHDILQAKLPAVVITAMQNMPYRFYAEIVLIITALLLLLSCINLWRQKNSGRWLFVIACVMYSIYNMLSGTQALYEWVSLFDDCLVLIASVIVTLLFCNPYRQLFVNQAIKTYSGLATVKNLRILIILNILSTILADVTMGHADPHMAKVFLDFQQSFSVVHINKVLWNYGGKFLLISYWAIIPLFFRLKFARRLYVIGIAGMLVADFFPPDVFPSVDSIFGGINVLLQIMIAVIVYCPPLSEKLIGSKKNKRLNIF